VNVMARFFVGVSIGVAATVGCYALAATTANHLAATFAHAPDAHQVRMSEFAVQLHERDLRFERLANPL
jgi:hypothetical protein